MCLSKWSPGWPACLGEGGTDNRDLVDGDGSQNLFTLKNWLGNQLEFMFRDCTYSHWAAVLG